MRSCLSRSRAFLPSGLFAGIALLLVWDLLSDLREGRAGFHLALEGAASLLTLLGLGWFALQAWSIYRSARDLDQDLEAAQAEARRWRADAQHVLDGLGAALGQAFDRWRLSEAEREIALLLLKGLSHKEIAWQRRTSEGTVRQQALSIYRKAGLSGRSSLAGFFLEGLSLQR